MSFLEYMGQGHLTTRRLSVDVPVSSCLDLRTPSSKTRLIEIVHGNPLTGIRCVH